MNFGPVLILIQINENEKRKCPSLGRGGLKEGGGAYPCLAVKRDGRVGVQEQMHILFPFLFVTGTLTLDSSFLMITEFYFI